MIELLFHGVDMHAFAIHYVFIVLWDERYDEVEQDNQHEDLAEDPKEVNQIINGQAKRRFIIFQSSETWRVNVSYGVLKWLDDVTVEDRNIWVSFS